MFKISDEVMNDDLIKKYLEEKDDSKFLIEINTRKDIGFRSGIVQLLDKKTVRINSHDCLDCTLKHLSSAIVQMGELQKGWWGTDHEIFCMGNLAEASEQIAGFSIDISNKLRDIRKDIFETVKKVEYRHITDCKKIFWEVKKLKSPESNKSIDIKTSSPAFDNRPCCGGKKKEENK